MDQSVNYTAFAQALLQRLDLHRNVKVFPYGIDINPHSHLDGALLIWLVAHATPDQVAAAEQQVHRK